VAAEVDDPDHVEGAAGEHAGQAAPQAVAHPLKLLGALSAVGLVACFVLRSESSLPACPLAVWHGWVALVFIYSAGYEAKMNMLNNWGYTPSVPENR
jgi:hypothetical protein